MREFIGFIIELSLKLLDHITHLAHLRVLPAEIGLEHSDFFNQLVLAVMRNWPLLLLSLLLLLPLELVNPFLGFFSILS